VPRRRGSRRTESHYASRGVNSCRPAGGGCFGRRPISPGCLPREKAKPNDSGGARNAGDRCLSSAHDAPKSRIFAASPSPRNARSSVNRLVPFARPQAPRRPIHGTTELSSLRP
jgi:hypothetical protein